MKKLLLIVLSAAVLFAVAAGCKKVIPSEPGYPTPTFTPTLTPVPGLAFTIPSTGVINRVNFDGTGTTPVTATVSSLYSVSNISKNGKIAYVRYDTHMLYLMNTDGTGNTQLVYSGQNNSPTISSDGMRVVYTKYVTQNDIYYVNTSTHAETDLSAFTGQAGYYPALSANGQNIVYNAGNDIVIMDATGGNRNTVWTHTGSDYATTACLSPDAKLIAFIHNAGAPDYFKIAVMNNDGSGLTDVYPLGNVNPGAMRWLPVANKILFEANLTGLGMDIWAIDPDGGNLKNLTNISILGADCFMDWYVTD